jgi:membrane-bound metal-dependent hydrolase YbcI (DUF457 family)
MMGHTHALSGCAVWLVSMPLLSHAGMHLNPGEVAAGAAVCAGAALLPDLDHHDGTIANTYGPFTKVLCRGVAAISGGHRHATHTIAFAIAMALGCDWLSQHAVKAWWVVLFLIVGLGLRGVGVQVPRSDHFSALLNAALAGGITFLLAHQHFGQPTIPLHVFGLTLDWAGLAVGLGCLIHTLGDCLTPEGCPLLWPAQFRIEVPLVPRTDGAAEKWVIAPLLTFGVIILAVRSAMGDVAVHWLTRK